MLEETQGICAAVMSQIHSFWVSSWHLNDEASLLPVLICVKQFLLGCIISTVGTKPRRETVCGFEPLLKQVILQLLLSTHGKVLAI